MNTVATLFAKVRDTRGLAIPQTASVPRFRDTKRSMDFSREKFVAISEFQKQPKNNL
jgi:hypothetical protein